MVEFEYGSNFWEWAMGFLSTVRDNALRIRDAFTRQDEEYFDVIYVRLPRTVTRGERFTVEALNSIVLPPEDLEADKTAFVIETIELAPKTIIDDMHLTPSSGELTVNESPLGLRFVDGSVHRSKEWVVTAKATGEHLLRFTWRIDGIDYEKLLPFRVKSNPRQILKRAIVIGVPVFAAALATAFKPEMAELFRSALGWIQAVFRT